MDQQKLTQLDPKLRDVYQRVMGTSMPEPKTAATPQIQPVQTQTKPILTTPQPSIPPQPTIVSQSQPQAVPTPSQPAVGAQPTPNFVQMNSEVHTSAPTATPAAFTNPNFVAPIQTQTTAVKKKGGILPVLFVFVGLIFIVIYTLFWTKIFNYKLPFKLPFLS
jgi:hypothetical protein